METRPVGESGVSISPVGLGGWELGPEEGEEPPVESARGALEAALAVGVNWVDTSEAYRGTRNEGLIGEAVRRLPDMQISSKVSPKPDGSGFRREEIKEACRASLQRLGRKQIDLYFLHRPDDTGVPIDETWGAMSELVEAGLVRAIGLSNYDLEEVERCHAQRRVDVVQDGLSMIDYLDQRQFFTRCGSWASRLSSTNRWAGESSPARRSRRCRRLGARTMRSGLSTSACSSRGKRSGPSPWSRA